MDKIKLEDFLEYSYLSGIKVTEYGTIFIKANIKKDKEILEEVNTHLHSMRDTWKEVMKRTGNGR